MNTQKVDFSTQLYEVGGWILDSNTWTFKFRTQAYTNNPSTGTSISLSVIDTSDFVVGSDVTISSSAGSETTYITAIVSNTSITVNQLLIDHTTTNPLITLLDTFTINADLSSILSKGTKVKFTQSSIIYGTIYSISVSGGITTVTLVHNTDYSLTNSAISETYYSYWTSPLGWPGWFNFDPAPLGWSVLPTNNLTYKYFPLGKSMQVLISQAGNGGTSNATTMSFSAPTMASAFLGVLNAATMDNNVLLTSPGRITINSSSRTITARSDAANGAWTNALGKRIISLLPFMEY